MSIGSCQRQRNNIQEETVPAVGTPSPGSSCLPLNMTFKPWIPPLSPISLYPILVLILKFREPHLPRKKCCSSCQCLLDIRQAALVPCSVSRHQNSMPLQLPALVHHVSNEHSMLPPNLTPEQDFALEMQQKVSKFFFSLLLSPSLKSRHIHSGKYTLKLPFPL